MEKTQLTILRKSLQFGDIANIARELGYSSQTVHSALNGVAMTEAAKRIIAHAQIIVKQRTERTQSLNK